MDKAVTQRVLTITGEKEVLSLLPAASVPPPSTGFETYLTKKREQEAFFNLFITALA